MKITLIFITLLLFAGSLHAQVITQDSTKSAQQYIVVKNNGNEYIGEILSDDGREVLMLTEKIGKVYIPKSDIKSIVKLEKKSDIVHGEYRSSGPFTTRYAFTNNAHPIRKGENYTMVNLYGPEVHFAVSNNFNIGIMSTWIASPLVLAMKYTFKKTESKVNFSAGTLLGTSGYLNKFKSYGGLHWLSMTIGDRMNNLTFSGGYGYIQSGAGNDLIPEGVYFQTLPEAKGIRPMVHGPLCSLAGILKVGAKASFVFDSMVLLFHRLYNEVGIEELSPGYYNGPNYIAPVYNYTVRQESVATTGLLLMPGMRFQTSENKAFQISLAGVSVFGRTSTSFPFPMCSWFYKF